MQIERLDVVIVIAADAVEVVVLGHILDTSGVSDICNPALGFRVRRPTLEVDGHYLLLKPSGEEMSSSECIHKYLH